MRLTSLSLALLSLCCISFSNSLSADTPTKKSDAPKEKRPMPWLVGPLLTPGGHVVPQGHFNFEPYEYVTTNYGIYNHNWKAQSTPNFYNLISQVPIQYGIPANMDIQFVPTWTWNHFEGASHWVLNDMGIGLDYQILNDKMDKWWPAIKLQLRGNLPIGRYQKLHPKSKGTDIGGTGSWLPGAGFVLSHLYWWGGHYFFAPRFNVQYTIPTSVHVKGYNTYGGGHHTHGTVIPGQTLQVLFGFEISLSQRWALAGDIDYFHVNKTRFHGHKGSTAGVPNKVGLPSIDQWSIAPAIEYNFSAYVGIIAGVWFSVAGRNAPEFASGVVAVNIYK